MYSANHFTSWNLDTRHKQECGKNVMYNIVDGKHKVIEDNWKQFKFCNKGMIKQMLIHLYYVTLKNMNTHT